MTSATARPDARPGARASSASIVPSVPGVPWWGAVLIALVLTAVGAVIAGSRWGDGGVPVVLWVGLLLGSVLAVAAVRRRAVFTGMVQPPLIGALVVFLQGWFSDTGGTLIAAVNVVKAFPLLAIATLVAVVIGVVRIFTAPLRTTPAARSRADDDEPTGL